MKDAKEVMVDETPAQMCTLAARIGMAEEVSSEISIGSPVGPPGADSTSECDQCAVNNTCSIPPPCSYDEVKRMFIQSGSEGLDLQLKKLPKDMTAQFRVNLEKAQCSLLRNEWDQAFQHFTVCRDCLQGIVLEDLTKIIDLNSKEPAKWIKQCRRSIGYRQRRVKKDARAWLLLWLDALLVELLRVRLRSLEKTSLILVEMIDCCSEYSWPEEQVQGQSRRKALKGHCLMEFAYSIYEISHMSSTGLDEDAKKKYEDLALRIMFRPWKGERAKLNAIEAIYTSYGQYGMHDEALVWVKEMNKLMAELSPLAWTKSLQFEAELHLSLHHPTKAYELLKTNKNNGEWGSDKDLGFSYHSLYAEVLSVLRDNAGKAGDHVKGRNYRENQGREEEKEKSFELPKGMASLPRINRLIRFLEAIELLEEARRLFNSARGFEKRGPTTYAIYHILGDCLMNQYLSDPKGVYHSSTDPEGVPYLECSKSYLLQALQTKGIPDIFYAETYVSLTRVWNQYSEDRLNELLLKATKVKRSSDEKTFLDTMLDVSEEQERYGTQAWSLISEYLYGAKGISENWIELLEKHKLVVHIMQELHFRNLKAQAADRMMALNIYPSPDRAIQPGPSIEKADPLRALLLLVEDFTSFCCPLPAREILEHQIQVTVPDFAIQWAEKSRAKSMLHQLEGIFHTENTAVEIKQFDQDWTYGPHCLQVLMQNFGKGTVAVMYSSRAVRGDYFVYVLRPLNPVEMRVCKQPDRLNGLTADDRLTRLLNNLGSAKNLDEDALQKRFTDVQEDLEYFYTFLIEPISKLLKPMKSKDNLIFLPDETLVSLPFHALRDPSSESGGRPYLIQRHTVSFAPSIRVLSNLIRRWGNLKRTPLYCKEGALVAVGDPAYKSRRKRDLPDTRVEVDFIYENFGKETRVKKLLGVEATPQKVLECAQLPKGFSQALVHIGAHASDGCSRGALELARPGLKPETTRTSSTVSGFKTRSANEDQTRASNEGQEESEEEDTLPEDNSSFADLGAILRGGEPLIQTARVLSSENIYGCGFSWQTRLVVLSACHTVKGEIRLEGVLNFPRSFMLVGVPCVAASQWKVQDKSTCALMQYFYSELKDGATVGRALRQSMLRMIEERNQVNQWAPFVIWGWPDVDLFSAWEETNDQGSSSSMPKVFMFSEAPSVEVIHGIVTSGKVSGDDHKLSDSRRRRGGRRTYNGGDLVGGQHESQLYYRDG